MVETSWEKFVIYNIYIYILYIYIYIHTCMYYACVLKNLKYGITCGEINVLFLIVRDIQIKTKARYACVCIYL